MSPSADWLIKPGGLADQLRGLRKAARLTQARLAENCGWDRTKVVKIENGTQAPSEDDVRAWAQACGKPEEAPKLANLLAEGHAEHRLWRHRRRLGAAALQTDWERLVRQASVIRNFELTVVPGLLQTADYARSRLEENERVYGAMGDVDEAIAARMRRQVVLYEPGHQFEFVILETALRLRVCPPEVMLGQLDRLLSVIGLPNVTLGILPLAVDVALLPLHGFIILDDVVYIETYASEVAVRAGEAAPYKGIADTLMRESVTGEEARHLILETAAWWRAGIAS